MSQNVNINLVPGNYPKEFHVSQYDVGRQLVANIVDSTGAYSIPSGATVTLVGTKPSGFGFTLNGSVGSGGVVTFSTTATVTAEYGRIPCEIRIESGNTVLGTANCMLIVEMSPHPEGTTDGDGEVIVNQITLLLEQITQQADRADDAKEDAEAAANEAKTSELAAEGYAVGKQNGTDVGPESPYYRNNCKWYGAQFDEALKDYAKINGYYKDMTVGTAKQLLSDSTTTDTEPYIYRQTAGDGDREEVEVVGGTVAWNQLVNPSTISATQTVNGVTFTNNGDGSVTANGTATADALFTVVPDRAWATHKYLLIGCPSGGSETTFSLRMRGQGVDKPDYGNGTIWNASGNAWKGIKIAVKGGATVSNKKFYPNIVDLTAMFGSTIADHIYSLEQATAGAGVAWFKKLFPKSYYPYNAGELMSVKTSAHVTKDADENAIGNYPLSPIDLRGIPKWVDGRLKFDGDVYEPNGTVNRRYGIVNLGTLNWIYDGDEIFRAPDTRMKFMGNGICTKYKWVQVASWSQVGDGEISVTNSEASPILRVHDSTAGTDATAFKSAMSGVYLVYELATPTTETADPYTAIQVCDPNGTEEWTDERTVPIPVGNVTKYHTNLKEKLEDLPAIPTAPSANGTYTLKATVSGGAVTYQWVNG